MVIVSFHILRDKFSSDFSPNDKVKLNVLSINNLVTMTIRYFLSKISIHGKLNPRAYIECKNFYPLIHQLKKNAIDYYIDISFLRRSKIKYFPCFVLKNKDYYEIFHKDILRIDDMLNITFSETSLKILMKNDILHKLFMIPDYFMNKYKDRLNWGRITDSMSSNRQLAKYSGYVNWKSISERTYLREKTLKKFHHCLVWSEVLKNMNHFTFIKYNRNTHIITFSSGETLNIRKYITKKY